jgi:hypothetical protein
MYLHQPSLRVHTPHNVHCRVTRADLVESGPADRRTAATVKAGSVELSSLRYRSGHTVNLGLLVEFGYRKASGLGLDLMALCGIAAYLSSNLS